MQNLLTEKLPDIKRIMREHKIQKAYAFGSVCTDSFRADSDVDFIVKFEDSLTPLDYADNYFNAIYKLEALLKRTVELVAEETLQNPYFIKVVNKTKTPIYGG